MKNINYYPLMIKNYIIPNEIKSIKDIYIKISKNISIIFFLIFFFIYFSLFNLFKKKQNYTLFKNNINKMLYDELIQVCIDALNQYNPDIEGPDSFFDVFIKKVKIKKITFLFTKIDYKRYF